MTTVISIIDCFRCCDGVGDGSSGGVVENIRVGVSFHQLRLNLGLDDIG